MNPTANTKVVSPDERYAFCLKISPTPSLNEFDFSASGAKYTKNQTEIVAAAAAKEIAKI